MELPKEVHTGMPSFTLVEFRGFFNAISKTMWQKLKELSKDYGTNMYTRFHHSLSCWLTQYFLFTIGGVSGKIMWHVGKNVSTEIGSWTQSIIRC
jgi:hypothetical protein